VKVLKEVKVEDLKPGDLIYIVWSDAWESNRVPLINAEYDAVWHEWGVFLFVKGRKKKHLVMAYNKKPGEITEWDITAIPIDLILKVVLVQPEFIQKILPRLIERLLSRANSTIPKKLDFNVKTALRWSIEHVFKMDKESFNEA